MCEEKEYAAAAQGLPPDTYHECPYADWALIRATLGLQRRRAQGDAMRICADKLYQVVETGSVRTGPYGVWAPAPPRVSIRTGAAIQGKGITGGSGLRPYVTGEAVPIPGARYELDDGHLPGHRPIVLDFGAVVDWLKANPFSTVRINP